jgi:hypothetical protein
VAKQLHWQAELPKILQSYGISYFFAHYAMVNWDFCAGIMFTPKKPI